MDNLRDLLVKRPFARIEPSAKPLPKINSLDYRAPYNTRSSYEWVPQIEFLREYDPSGHKINSDAYYPDHITYDEVKKQYYTQKVWRASFPFQRIIHAQQLVHLCGNDIHIELTGLHNTTADRDLLLTLRKKWLDRDVETAFYQLAAATKKTGDAALVFYFKDRQIRWRTLAFDKGDTLYPHYDDNGDLSIFARQYNAYDIKGKIVTTFVEVWDERNMTVYRRSERGVAGAINRLKDYFGIDGYEVAVPPTPHGFNEVPIVYVRDDGGACWSAVQNAIDKYELAISHLCQNNMAYAFPIMVLKGESVDIKADIYGAVKYIDTSTDGSAQYLEPQGNVEAFKLQLETLLKQIFLGSFAVMPPEVRSGDLPGVAIKLIYAPSIDKAMNDAKQFQGAILKLLRLFKHGVGVEIAAVTRMAALDTYAWIEPYVHQNMSELVNNLVSLVNSGLLSQDTATGIHGYGENNEVDKIITEQKMANAADLLEELGNDEDGPQGNSETVA